MSYGEERLEKALVNLAELEVRKDKIVKEQLFELAAELRQEFRKVEIEVLEARKIIAIENQEFTEAGYYLDEQTKLKLKLKG